MVDAESELYYPQNLITMIYQSPLYVCQHTIILSKKEKYAYGQLVLIVLRL